MHIIHLSRFAQPRLSGSTFALLQSGTQATPVPLFRLLARLPSGCSHAPLLLCFLLPTPNLGCPFKESKRLLPSLRNCSPLLKLILGKFRKKLFSSTALPTNSSLSAILRESAAASPRFAYAVILTLPPRVSQNTPTQTSRLIDALPPTT